MIRKLLRPYTIAIAISFLITEGIGLWLSTLLPDRMSWIMFPIAFGITLPAVFIASKIEEKQAPRNFSS